MDSTACLVGSDASYFDLPFQLFSAGQGDVEHDYPITRHLKVQLRLVAPRLFFLRICEHGTHPSVRHVRFNRHARCHNRFAACIGELESECCDADTRRRRGDLMLNCDQVRRLDRSGTADYTQSCRAHETHQNSTKHSLIRQLWAARGGPTRTCKPRSPVHPLAETRGSTFR